MNINHLFAENTTQQQQQHNTEPDKMEWNWFGLPAFLSAA
jgi:hypothetical protein